jgi:hypothetical protein
MLDLKERNMKRYTWALPIAAVVTFVLLAAFVRAKALPQIDATVTNSANGVKILGSSLALANETRGVVFKTAAINADGSVASCFRCVKLSTIHLSTGQYQVAFDENVQATNGFSRWVQVDTLAFGSENAFCATADRAGNTNAVFVNCQHVLSGNSVPVDASFFIFVAR